MIRLAQKPLSWASRPKQARSQERLERILDAAEEAIADKGFERSSIAEIMTRAGSSVGLFYQRFKTKDDLLRCLLARFTEESVATIDAALDVVRWRAHPISAIVSETVPYLLSVYRQKRGLLRAFLLKASVDEHFNQMAHASEEHLAKRLATLLIARAAEISHPDPPRAIDLAYQMLRSTLNTLVLFSLDRRAGYSLDSSLLEEELPRAFLRILGVENPTGRGGYGKRSKSGTRKSQTRRNQ